MSSQEASEPKGALHGLEELKRLSQAQVRDLQARWIDSVEALLGAMSTEATRVALARLLNESEDGMTEIQDEAKALLGPSRSARCTSGQAGGPTGALLTDEQKRELGFPEAPDDDSGDS